jgi:DNA-binding winged helix-turn-helix (wHTH) protein
MSHLDFEHVIGAVFECGLDLVILFDEFELLSQNENLGLSFFSGLRALATRFGLAYLTSSGRPLLGLPHTDDYSPFFNIFVPLKLCLLDEKASRELIDRSLIKAGASLPPEIVDHVLTIGGGHPFFLQVAGYWALELQDAKEAPLTSRDIHLLEQSVRGQIESHLAYYWNHLSATERYVLAALSFAQEEERFREELESLAAFCLIVKVGSPQEDGRYRHFSPLFSEFARRQEVEGLLQSGPFVLDLAHRRVLLREEPLALSTSQYDLLAYLLERQGQVISSQELDQEALGTPGESYEYLSDERLKSAIKGLRKALGEDARCVENKRGIGYTFRIRSPEEV